MIPTFHASSSTTLEAAIALSSINDGDGGGGGISTSLQGYAGQLEEASLQANDVPRNASDLESKGTVNGWSVSESQSAEGSVVWEACRYYEVGDVKEGVQQVISNSILGENLGLTPF